MYRKDEIEDWKNKLLPVQKGREGYVTVDECREALGLSSKSLAFLRLRTMVRQGAAKVMKIRNVRHYHIIEER